VATKKKRNPYVGGNLMDSIHRWKATDPEFAARHEEEFDKLQLARRVKELREAQKMSQGELARLAGTRQPAIARLESGRVLPRLDLLHRIAAALGMRVDVQFKREAKAS